MSYPGYPPNNKEFPGQPGTQPSGSLPYPPYPPYPSVNIGLQGYSMPSPYSPGQPSCPQQSTYTQGSHYPPQQPGQLLPQSGQYVPNPSMYPPSTVGQYPPSTAAQYPPSTAEQFPPSPYPLQVSPYPSVQPSSNYPPQSIYPSTQQTPLVYPNMKADGYGGHFQGPPQAKYPPTSIPAHQPLGNSLAQKKSNPTLSPVNPFDAQHDAEILRKAMKGFGTDEKAIIDVLAHRVNSQRQEISRQFKTMYGKDLISNLKSELSGRFEDLIIALMTPIHDYLAKELHDAIAGIGTDEETIVEIMCTASNAEVNSIIKSYQNKYGKHLEKDLKGDTSGYFCRLLVSLCQGNRSESTVVDVASAQADAQSLFKAGENRCGTDEATFNMILCSRSFCQLKQIFSEYKRLTGKDFDNVIKSEFSGDIKNGHRAIVQFALDKNAYYAKRLHESMAGLGTDDKALIRIVATRCEIDMVDIKNAYSSKYGKSLETDIAGDTSGHYKKCLMALVDF